MERVESDARAALASGRSDLDLDEVRDRFEVLLADGMPAGKEIPRDLWELNNALGVA